MSWGAVAIAWLLCGLIASARAFQVLFRHTRILFDDVERLQNDTIKAGPNAGEIERLRLHNGLLEDQKRTLSHLIDEAQEESRRDKERLEQLQAQVTREIAARLTAQEDHDRLRAGLASALGGRAADVEGVGDATLMSRVLRRLNGEPEFEPVPPPRKKRERKPKATVEVVATVEAAPPVQVELTDAIAGAS